MADDEKIPEVVLDKAAEENIATIDRALLAHERREAEQRKRLDELRAHAAAAQAQCEKRDEVRRRRQAEQKARDDERRQQVEERKRALWDAYLSRREALLKREEERAERLERTRAARSTCNSAFAFGSSTPRLLDPVDSAGCFWAARRAASTTNVMFASAPLTRPASAIQLNLDNDNKDESYRPPQTGMWSSVARRRTDLVPTQPAPRAPETRSGETTPGSRPGSAMSSTTPGVVRRQTFPRRLRPVSIAGTGVNTPNGGSGDTGSQSVVSTPSVSRDGTLMPGDDVTRGPKTPRRPARSIYLRVLAEPGGGGDGDKPIMSRNTSHLDRDDVTRRPIKARRSVSMRAAADLATGTNSVNPAEGKPPVHRKPKSSKGQDKTPHVKSMSASPGRTLSPPPSASASKEPSVDKEVINKANMSDKSQVSAIEVTQKLEALQIQSGKENNPQNQILQKEDKKDAAQDKVEENEMTASMTARRITTEEEAKAALAERRRRAREELERQAELEKQRLQREAEEEAERQRQEEVRQRREEEEACELAQLQRRMEEEKLRKAIEAHQQLERDEAERKAREEADRQARLKEEEDKRKAAEEAERLRKEEAEREEKERLARKQRVEAIMARTRLKKQAEEQYSRSTSAEVPAASPAPAAATAQLDNGNAFATGDLLGLSESQMNKVNVPEESAPQSNYSAAPAQAADATPNNGNVTENLLGLSEKNNIEDKANNGNVQQTNNVGHVSANFLQAERMDVLRYLKSNKINQK